MTQKTDRSKKAVATHRKVQSSTTRSRKAVKRPSDKDQKKSEKSVSAKASKQKTSSKSTKTAAAKAKKSENSVEKNAQTAEASVDAAVQQAVEKVVLEAQKAPAEEADVAEVLEAVSEPTVEEIEVAVEKNAEKKDTLEKAVKEQVKTGDKKTAKKTETQKPEKKAETKELAAENIVLGETTIEPEVSKEVTEKTEAEIEAEEPVVIVPKIQRYSDRSSNATTASRPVAQAKKPEPQPGNESVKVEFKTNVVMPQADLSQVHARMRMRKTQAPYSSSNGALDVVNNTYVVGAPNSAATVLAGTAQAQVASVRKRPTAKELKEKAIHGALMSAARESKQKAPMRRVRLGWQRIVLALSCAVAIVAAVAYFVNLNSPNISLKVAAMQSGIQASYPSYVPRDFSLTDITSESGKITLNFKNTEGNVAYSITEESSPWDSNALLNNYVKTAFGTDYTAVKEQGLTLYTSSNNSEMVWVSGGVLYKIKVKSGSLTKKQITTIATSL